MSADFRPSPALRRLYSNRDRAYNMYHASCAEYWANQRSTFWRDRADNDARRWAEAFSVLCSMAWEQEQEERRG